MLPKGTILRNRYTIIKSLGNGDFGDTYLAKDTRTPENPRCVIKHLQPKDSNPIVLDTARRIFETEAKTLAELGKQSPQIPTLLAHFEERGEFYLVWKFIDGDNLTKEIIPGKKLTEIEVIALLKSILEVLVVAHEYKLYTVIHRDLKPENIIRRRDGKIVLVDFGGIREINQLVVNDKGDVAPAIAIGTPGYQSREQARGKSQPASDIYAVGMLGIQALTGLNLRSLLTLKDANTGEIVWRNLVPDVDPRLAEVLETMVFDRFLSRYQNAREALQAISSLVPRQIPIIGTIGKFLEQPIARRRVLQLGGLTGAGLVVGIVSHNLVKNSSLGNESGKTPPVEWDTNPSYTPMPSSRLSEELNVPMPTSVRPIRPTLSTKLERYRKTSCGSIIDSKTALEWYVGADQNVSWDETVKWATTLSSCNRRWRMPTINELESLYDKNYTAGQGYFSKGSYYPAHIHPTFSAIGGGSWVWSDEKVGNNNARSYNFNQGVITDYSRNDMTYSTRAFAVSSIPISIPNTTPTN